MFQDGIFSSGEPCACVKIIDAYSPLSGDVYSRNKTTTALIPASTASENTFHSVAQARDHIVSF